MDGFNDVVRQAWDCNLSNIDACRVLDFKLRRTAKALKSWSMRNVGSVRLHLFMAREIIAQLDVAQESRDLTDDDLSLRGDLKCHSLGLASFTRTMVRHRSRIRFLEEGDANTKKFSPPSLSQAGFTIPVRKKIRSPAINTKFQEILEISVQI